MWILHGEFQEESNTFEKLNMLSVYTKAGAACCKGN